MRILLIAPNCYPVEGAESIVNIKLLQAFARYDDIHIDLVTRSHSSSTYPSGDVEKYGIRVDSLHIVDSCNKLNFKTAWQTLMCFAIFGVGFRGSVWAYTALPVVQSLVKKNNYDFVLTKSRPSFLLGSFLHKCGLRWVASWNDPYPEGYYPYPYSDGLAHHPSFIEKLIIRQMRKADFHVFPTRKLLELMRCYLKFDIDKAKVIPHVVLDGLQTWKPFSNTGENNTLKLNIIHSGNLNSSRSPQSFFIAIENMLAKHPYIKISISVLGNVAPEHFPSREKFPLLSKCFKCMAPVEYTRALQVLNNYSLACIIEAPCNDGEAVFLPTKVTDFMQVGIPIMAISPKDGVLHEMYKCGIIGYYCNVRDERSIEYSLLKAYRDLNSNGLTCNNVDESFYPSQIVKGYRDIAIHLLK